MMMNQKLKVSGSLNKGLLSFQEVGSSALSMSGLGGGITCNGEEYDLKNAELVIDTPDRAEFVFQNGIRWIRTLKATETELVINNAVRNESKDEVQLKKWAVLGVSTEGKPAWDLGTDPAEVRQFFWCPWTTSVKKVGNGDKELFAVSVWHMYNPAEKKVLFMSFTSIIRMYTTFYMQIKDNNYSFTANSDTREYMLQPGQELEAETLRITYHTDPFFPLEDWADEMNKKYKPCFDGTAGIIFGSGGWSDAFTHINKAEAEEADARCREASKTVFAGFDRPMAYGGTHYIMKGGIPGNWLTFEKRYDGTDPGDRLKEAHEKEGWGFKLWFSPFWFFGEADGILEENKDNLLKYPDGTPAKNIFKGGWEFGRGKFGSEPLTQYYLDGTHPKTVEYLKHIFTKYREMGARGYMLDFLESIPGTVPYDRSMLPLTAGRNILQTIRETVTYDTHLQTAVGSIPAYIGCVNTARVVRDYGETRPQYPFPNWLNASYCQHDDHFSNIHSFTQNVAAAWFTNNKLYINDLNELIMDIPVPLAQARLNVTFFGLNADSPVSLGDDISRMDPARLDMLKLLLPRTTGVPTPVDLFDSPEEDGGCHILRKTINASYGTYTLAAVFNSKADADTYKKHLTFAELHCDPEETYRVFEFWNNEYVGTFKGGFDVSVEPGGCKLYRIAKAEKHPWLLSSTMHIEQGNAEIKSLVWDEEKLELRATVTRPAGSRGQLYFLVPLRMRAINNGKCHTMREVYDMQTVLSREVVFENDVEEVVIPFERYESDHVARIGWLPYTTEAEWHKYLEEHKKPGDTRVIY